MELSFTSTKHMIYHVYSPPNLLGIITSTGADTDKGNQDQILKISAAVAQLSTASSNLNHRCKVKD